MGQDNHHGHHAGNDSKAKFGIIFALLLFFALSVAGNQVFVASKEAPSVQHFSESGEVDHDAAKSEEPTEEKQNKATRKRH